MISSLYNVHIVARDASRAIISGLKAPRDDLNARIIVVALSVFFVSFFSTSSRIHLHIVTYSFRFQYSTILPHLFIYLFLA